MLKIKVKASNITNLTDARYFAAREVEWLGFPLGSGGDAVDATVVKAMAEWVDGVKIVGEFELSTADEIRRVAELVGTDAVQVGMFTPLVDVRQLAGLTVTKEIVIDPSLSESELEAQLEMYAPYCAYFLLNFSKTGIAWQDLCAGSVISISFLQKNCKAHPILLELDCQPDELDEVMEKLSPAGLSFSGGEEEKVGFKSFDELDELLDQLEIAEYQ